MMTREELEAALDEQQTIQSEQWESYHADVKAGYMDEDTLQDWSSALKKHDLINAAARKQLALMPLDCPDCDGHGCFGFSELQPGGGESCKPCHGSGKVYPPETVEKIAEAIDSISDEVWGYRGRQAVAVLDALGETE